MTDHQPVPVYFRFCPVHETSVCRHWPRGEFKSALRARYLLPGSHVVLISHPCVLQSLGLCWHPLPWCARLAHHCAGLVDVSHENIPTKEAYQNVHQVLQPFSISGSNYAVINIKYSQALPDGLSHAVVGHPLVLHFHGQPFTDGIVHDHIEQFRRYKSALRCSQCGCEGWSVIDILSWHHFLAGPESLQEFTQARSRAIYSQVLDEAFPVNCVICLL